MEITVSAAMSLKNVFEAAGKVYEAQNRGVKVVFNFRASGDLIRQIEGGAPVDVFASAAQKDMALFPHMALKDNILYGAKGVAIHERMERLSGMIESSA